MLTNKYKGKITIVQYATLKDFNAWIALAREVEPLFGPMTDESSFQEALRQAMADKTAFCIRTERYSLSSNSINFYQSNPT